MKHLLTVDLISKTQSKKITSIASEMDTVPYFSPEIADRINIDDADDIPPPTSSSCSC